jgi:alpha-L-fucosidase
MNMNRRSFVGVTISSIVGCALPRRPRPVALPPPRPSPSQLAWQRDELALFLHFGVNTFTDREWGDGREDPTIFSPSNLDARQWTRAAKACGAKALILTAKHHDGFCLWPTRTTEHSVVRSPWRSGQGDVVREFVDACRAEGLKAGLYLSPWDRNSPVYGDSPRYNDFYCDQLSELLTRYGAISEVWFDGANGEGPNGRRQQYDWPRFFGLVRKLQPNAVMFSDVGPDVRWCGNESGTAGDPNWSTIDPNTVPYPGAPVPDIGEILQHGDPAGSVWRPAEVDVSIRPGWFYHSAEDDRVRSVDNLVSLYFTSVGRNGKLLLNVPPTREGLLHSTDIARLATFRDRLSGMFEVDIGSRARRTWRGTGARTAVLELDLGAPTTIGLARLEEDIRRGQSVAGYTLTGAIGEEWRVLWRGATIGYAKLDRFPTATMRRVRLTIDESVATPEPIVLRLYAPMLRQSAASALSATDRL